MSAAQRDAAIRRMRIERKGTRLLKALKECRSMAIRFGAPRMYWTGEDRRSMFEIDELLLECGILAEKEPE
jgi:hypothetical protein